MKGADICTPTVKPPVTARMAICAASSNISGAVGGFDEVKGGYLIAHRAAWLVLAAGVIALGMHDRQSMITAAGVVAMIAGVCTILFDLGLGLMTAAGLFAACALIALVAGFLTRSRKVAA